MRRIGAILLLMSLELCWALAVPRIGVNPKEWPRLIAPLDACAPLAWVSYKPYWAKLNSAVFSVSAPDMNAQAAKAACLR